MFYMNGHMVSPLLKHMIDIYDFMCAPRVQHVVSDVSVFMISCAPLECNMLYPT